MFHYTVTAATSSFTALGVDETELTTALAGIESGLAVWGRYIDAPDVNLAIRVVGFDDTPSYFGFFDAPKTLAAGASSYVAQGGDYVSVPVEKLETGIDLNGSTTDGTIYLNSRLMGGGTYEYSYSNKLPMPNYWDYFFGNRDFDFRTIVQHELMHVFGAVEGIAQFDANVKSVNGKDAFVGSNAVAANGGKPVNLSSDGSHSSDSDLFGPTVAPYHRAHISPLDVAMLKDIGVPIVEASQGDDRLWGFVGVDSTLSGRNGNDILYGFDGNDRLIGGNGNDRLLGNSGNDVQYGGNGHDQMFGGAGNDRLFGGSGNDAIRGHSGDDVLRGHGGNDTLNGGGGNDVLSGGAGRDYVFGNAGMDTFYGDAGNDQIDGGSGFDTLRLAGAQSGYRITELANGDIRVADIDASNGSLGTDTLTGIEKIVFSDGSEML